MCVPAGHSTTFNLGIILHTTILISCYTLSHSTCFFNHSIYQGFNFSKKGCHLEECSAAYAETMNSLNKEFQSMRSLVGTL